MPAAEARKAEDASDVKVRVLCALLRIVTPIGSFSERVEKKNKEVTGDPDPSGNACLMCLLPARRSRGLVVKVMDLI